MGLLPKSNLQIQSKDKWGTIRMALPTTFPMTNTMSFTIKTVNSMETST